MTYLLHCTGCQQSIPVEIAQAGETVRCDCGTDMPVPRLRELRRLPTGDSSVAPDLGEVIAGSTSWSKSRRYLFSLGFLIAVISVGTAVSYYLSAAKIKTGDVHGEQLEQDDQMIDSLDAERAYELWKLLQNDGIGEKIKSAEMIKEEKREGYKLRFRIALYVFAFGLLVMGVGMFVVKPRSTRSP